MQSLVEFAAQEVGLAADLRPELSAYAARVVADPSLSTSDAADRLIAYAQALNTMAGRTFVLGEQHPRAMVLSGRVADLSRVPQPVHIVLDPLTIFEDGSALCSTGVHATFLTALGCVDSSVVTLFYSNAKPGDRVTSIREWLEARGLSVAIEHFL